MPPVPDLSTVHDFLLSTIAVLRETTGTSAVVAMPEIRHGHDNAVAIIVHARGDLTAFTWTFPFEMLQDAARFMVDGIEPDRSLCEATASELANILTGRGAAALESHGLFVDIQPPVLGAFAQPGTIAFLATPRGVIEIVFHPQPGADEV